MCVAQHIVFLYSKCVQISSNTYSLHVGGSFLSFNINLYVLFFFFGGGGGGGSFNLKNIEMNFIYIYIYIYTRGQADN